MDQRTYSDTMKKIDKSMLFQMNDLQEIYKSLNRSSKEQENMENMEQENMEKKEQENMEPIF